MRVLRLTAALLLLACALCASQVQVVDTLKNADGTLSNGTITISWPAMKTGDGTFVKNQKTYTITNGVVNVMLEANVGASPANTSYNVQYNLREGSNTVVYKEAWIVPASDIPVSIADIRQAQVIESPVGLNVDQITGLGPGDILVGTSGLPIKLHAPGTGTFCLQSIFNNLAWQSCGGGSGGHLQLITIGHTLLSSIGHKQLAFLGN